MYNFLLLTVFVLVARPCVAYNHSINYTAAFDNIQGQQIPSPYKGLNYTNFQISKAHSFIQPKSAPNMISAAPPYQLLISEIHVVQEHGQDYQFAELNSLYMACLSCIGSNCYSAGNVFPLQCEVTVVAFIDNIAYSSVQTSVLVYNPPHIDPSSDNGNNTMKKVFPQNGTRLEGTNFRFYLTGGAIGTTIYFDNINYRFRGFGDPASERT